WVAEGDPRQLHRACRLNRCCRYSAGVLSPSGATGLGALLLFVPLAAALGVEHLSLRQGDGRVPAAEGAVAEDVVAVRTGFGDFPVTVGGDLLSLRTTESSQPAGPPPSLLPGPRADSVLGSSGPGGDVFGDGQRAGCRGRGSVEDVDLVRRGVDEEVVEQCAVRVEILGSDTGVVADDVRLGDSGNQPGEARGEASLRHGADHLVQSGRVGVPTRESPGAGERGDGGQLRHGDVGPTVALPAQREYRVRTGVDTAVEHPGQVYPEER